MILHWRLRQGLGEVVKRWGFNSSSIRGVAQIFNRPNYSHPARPRLMEQENHFPAFTYEVLSKHTIVMLSPKELGYTNLKRLAMDRGVQLESERNQVFDVLGIDVDAIRDKFTGCEWVVCDDYNTQDANGNLVQVGRLRELLGAQKSVEPSRVKWGRWPRGCWWRWADPRLLG